MRTFNFGCQNWTEARNTLHHFSSHISLLFVTLGDVGPAYQSHHQSYVPTFSPISPWFLYLTSLPCNVAMRNADGRQGSDFPLKDRSNKLSLFRVVFEVDPINSPKKPTRVFKRAPKIVVHQGEKCLRLTKKMALFI